MGDSDWLAERFEEYGSHLRAVAYRILGSASEAEDAVQEAWLKVSRSDAGDVTNLGGWLTTMVARVCLDMLRTRRSRREEPLASMPDTAASEQPDDDIAVADATGQALLVVLETLKPVERVAFVLHDLFDFSFEEIAPIVARTPAATRQLASRARRRVRGGEVPPTDVVRRRELVGAFLAASREGDFDRLLAVLSPEVVLCADRLSVRTAEANRQHGAPILASEVRGASSVAEVFKGRARGALRAFIDGDAGAVWAPGGQVRGAFIFTIEGERIAGIDLVMEPERLAELDVRID